MSWWFYLPEEELIEVVRREIHSKNTIDKIVVDIEREIHIPPAISLDEIRGLVEQMLNDYHSMMIRKTSETYESRFKLSETDLKKISQEVILTLRQEIHEEISRSQVNLDDKLKKNLGGIDGRIQKLEEGIANQSKIPPTISSPVDLTPIQNAIKQMQATQQQIVVRLGQAETKLNSSKPAVVPVGGSSGISQAQFEAQNREIEALRKKFEAQSQNYANIKSALDIRTLENTSLKQTISKQEQRLLKLEEKNAQQSQEISDVKKQLKDLQETLSHLMDAAPYQAPASPVSTVTHIQPVSTSVEPWIKSFSISKSTSPNAFFHGDGANVKAKLAQSIQNMDGLITYLTQSKINEPARTSFMKNLRWCMEALEKLYGKFDFDGYDSEEISEEITGKFFKIISENLLDNVMVAIYRGGKDAVGYQEFLQIMNRYLSMHGIYTEDILPGTLIEGDMLSNIEPPISKQTSVAVDDGKVDEVELLPYFMLYEDDDGNLDTVRKRGRVVRLKYGA